MPPQLQAKIILNTGKDIDNISLMEFINELDRYCISWEKITRLTEYTNFNNGIGGNEGEQQAAFQSKTWYNIKYGKSET